MSRFCFVPGCYRMLTDTAEEPACRIHWAKARWHTRERWALKTTATEYMKLLAQLLCEIEGIAAPGALEESIAHHPAGSHL